jgi:hypothetical protein
VSSIAIKVIRRLKYRFLSQLPVLILKAISSEYNKSFHACVKFEMTCRLPATRDAELPRALLRVILRPNSNAGNYRA